MVSLRMIIAAVFVVITLVIMSFKVIIIHPNEDHQLLHLH